MMLVQALCAIPVWPVSLARAPAVAKNPVSATRTIAFAIRIESSQPDQKETLSRLRQNYALVFLKRKGLKTAL
jgi:hypothetical protein